MKFLISSPLSAAVSILSLLFVVLHQGRAATPQQGTPKSDRQQTMTGNDPRFLSALRAYKAQQYEAAQKQLEPLVETAPDSFQINELLGLVYVAQGEQAKANRFLAKAVRLNPTVTEARTALATNLLALQRADEAEIHFRKAVELNPRAYDTNNNLGEFYIRLGELPPQFRSYGTRRMPTQQPTTTVTIWLWLLTRRASRMKLASSSSV